MFTCGMRFGALKRWTTGLCLLWAIPWSLSAKERPQDTGFLNRTVTVGNTLYRFQVYVPEQWKPHQKWPILLFLHGRGERGSEGMWQTQVGLPTAVRDHPERWPFVIVMPQCNFRHYWTDPEMLAMAMAAFNQEQKEFNGDPDRSYLTGLSMGGYGSWELARQNPRRFAAIAIVSGGIFWSYSPQRWKEQNVLPAEYASRIGHTPIWLFHGTDDPVVAVKQSELMYEAFKSSGGHIRLWEYAGYHHNAWDRAYNDPDLPRWLLAHKLSAPSNQPYAEKLLVPIHPAPIKLNPLLYDAYTGQYEGEGVLKVTIFRQADHLYQRNAQGEVTELLAENPSTFFYPSGGVTRLNFEREGNSPARAILFHDDRHEERWTRVR